MLWVNSYAKLKAHAPRKEINVMKNISSHVFVFSLKRNN